MSAYSASAFLLLCAILLPSDMQTRGGEHFLDLLTVTRVEGEDPVPAGRRLTLAAPVKVMSDAPRAEPALTLLGHQVRASWN